MAKNTFAAGTFKAGTFASGTWTGVGVTPPPSVNAPAPVVADGDDDDGEWGGKGGWTRRPPPRRRKKADPAPEAPRHEVRFTVGCRATATLRVSSGRRLRHEWPGAFTARASVALRHGYRDRLAELRAEDEDLILRGLL